MNSGHREHQLAQLGIALSKILLPRADIDLYKWAVVACDQFNNDIEYWKRVERIVGDAPSTLNYIIPEVYLDNDDEDVAQRIQHTQQKMLDDIANNTLRTIYDEENNTEKVAVWIRRHFTNGNCREGLLFALDLECYHYDRDAHTIIQATEETFRTRIKPRRDIRAQASIEVPHILVFYNDPNHTLRNALWNSDMRKKTEGAISSTTTLNISNSTATLVYETELMCGGGNVQGYCLDNNTLERVIACFQQLHGVQQNTHGALFFVGDGNHSLAAARDHWQELKHRGAADNHPARYALAELVNIHDPGLTLEPIHKYLNMQQHIDVQEVWRRLSNITSMPSATKNTDDASKIVFHNAEGDTLHHFVSPATPADVELMHILTRIFVNIDDTGNISRRNTDNTLSSENNVPIHSSLLFMHARDELIHTLSTHTGIAVEMPPLNRGMLLDYIANSGVLPRKSFSLGRPEEKRYYLECRAIIPD